MIVENKQEYLKFVCDTFDELKHQFLQKHEQYGRTDGLDNFRTGALLFVGDDSIKNMFAAALGYEAKHIAHVYNSGVEGNKVDESLKDIAIYSIIELYMHKKFLENNEK